MNTYGHKVDGPNGLRTDLSVWPPYSSKTRSKLENIFHVSVSWTRTQQEKHSKVLFVLFFFCFINKYVLKNRIFTVPDQNRNYLFHLRTPASSHQNGRGERKEVPRDSLQLHSPVGNSWEEATSRPTPPTTGTRTATTTAKVRRGSFFPSDVRSHGQRCGLRPIKNMRVADEHSGMPRRNFLLSV